jgi:hypothetical protein
VNLLTHTAAVWLAPGLRADSAAVVADDEHERADAGELVQVRPFVHTATLSGCRGLWAASMPPPGPTSASTTK